MPKSESAEKRIRQNEKERRRNKKRKTNYKSARAELEEAVAAGEDESTIEELKQDAQSQVDRAASKGAIHKNKAARLKSQLEDIVEQA